MINTAYQILKDLGPLASVFNFVLICGLVVVMWLLRTNDLAHVEQYTKDIKEDLEAYRTAMREDVQYIRARLDQLIDSQYRRDKQI